MCFSAEGAPEFLNRREIDELSSPPPPPPTPSGAPTDHPCRYRDRSYAEVTSGIPGTLAEAEMVYVRRGAVSPPLMQGYSGPYRVLERGPKVFRLQVGDKEEVISADRLKPHTGSTPAHQVAPPRRGRPPKL